MWIEADDPRIDQLWADAPADEATLLLFLESAQGQCSEFAPALPSGSTEVPANYVLALILQARALQRSTVAGSGDSLGGDGFTVTVFPMDWTVKNLLRPSHGVPVLG
ncbi:hypothetical protein ACFWGN_20670 [Oerskovia sp. NPDC060338]|uniref:hypothetical protein n=1 Tax=Oerskovia sp. NPDC060338 TaxID=3347100 RepID=UPI00364BB0F1